MTTLNPDVDSKGTTSKTNRTKSERRVSRRDVLRTVSATGVLSVGFAGLVRAESCDVACQAGSGPNNCNCATPDACRFITKSQVNGEGCVSVEVPEDAALAAIKAGRDCILYGDGDSETLNPGGTSEICIAEDCSGIGHVEFYSCPTANITVECDNDQAVIDVDDTDSVYWTVDYSDEQCDEPDKEGTQEFADSTGGTFTVSLADCVGSISVFTNQGGLQLGSADFYCGTPITGIDADCDRIVVSTKEDGFAGEGVQLAVDAATTADGVNTSTITEGVSCLSRNELVTCVDRNETDDSEELIYTYSEEPELSDETWTSLEVSIFDSFEESYIENKTLDVGPCNCVQCPSGLDLRFKRNEIEEGTSKTVRGVTFTITSVTTKHRSEPIGVCFSTDSLICKSALELQVKTGELEESAEITANNDGEYCFEVNSHDPFKDEKDPIQAISYFDIECLPVE